MTAWYDDEMGKYPGYTGEPSMDNFEEWGHYSQIVWKGSNKLGCARHHCDSATDVKTRKVYKNMDFIVCNYGPAGRSYWYSLETYADFVCRKCGRRLFEERCSEHLQLERMIYELGY